MEQRQTKNGVILLIVLSVIAKAIGVFYRIPLFAVLGANGIGLYQLVFPVYALTVAFFSGTDRFSRCLFAKNSIKSNETTARLKQYIIST